MRQLLYRPHYCLELLLLLLRINDVGHTAAHALTTQTTTR
jgi:hypothetical protein